MLRRLVIEKRNRGFHDENDHRRTVETAEIRQLLQNDRPRAISRHRSPDSDDRSDHDRGHHAELQASELHIAHQQRALHRAERRDHKPQRKYPEEALHLGLAIEVGDRACQDEPEQGEPRPGRRCCPEHGRPVVFHELLALHERRAQAQVGEDDHEAREHQHHSGQAVVVRREQPGQDHGNHQPQTLDHGHRQALPCQAVENPIAHRTGSDLLAQERVLTVARR